MDKLIKVEFSVNSMELQLLTMGKCEKPNPERIKRMLLREAARNLRTLCEQVLHTPPEFRGNYHRVNTKAELKEINAKRRADVPTHDWHGAKLPKYPHLPAKTNKAMADYERKRKPGRIPQGPKPEWMDDGNIGKLQEVGHITKPKTN